MVGIASGSTHPTHCVPVPGQCVNQRCLGEPGWPLEQRMPTSLLFVVEQADQATPFGICLRLFHRQTCPPPLGKPILEAPSLDAGFAQPRHGFIRQHAPGAAAIRHDFTIARQLF